MNRFSKQPELGTISVPLLLLVAFFAALQWLGLYSSLRFETKLATAMRHEQRSSLARIGELGKIFITDTLAETALLNLPSSPGIIRNLIITTDSNSRDYLRISRTAKSHYGLFRWGEVIEFAYRNRCLRQGTREFSLSDSCHLGGSQFLMFEQTEKLADPSSVFSRGKAPAVMLGLASIYIEQFSTESFHGSIIAAGTIALEKVECAANTTTTTSPSLMVSPIAAQRPVFLYSAVGDIRLPRSALGCILSCELVIDGPIRTEIGVEKISPPVACLEPYSSSLWTSKKITGVRNSG